MVELEHNNRSVGQSAYHFVQFESPRKKRCQLFNQKFNKQMLLLKSYYE